MTDHGWDHASGGMHALVWERDQLVGHESLVERRLPHGGRALRTSYLEGVAVRAERRGRGYGASMMDALELVVRDGTSWALTQAGLIRTEDDDDGLYVLVLAGALDLSGELICEWR